MHIITTILGRSQHAEKAWPHLRTRAGRGIMWIVVVDGDTDTPWHDVKANVRLAERYADVVVRQGSLKGNGAAMQAAMKHVTHDSPYIKVDADVLPSMNFARNLETLAYHTRHEPLGLLAGLPTPRTPRWNVGVRWMLPNQRLLLRVALFTPLGAAAVKNHTTKIPLNGHDLLVAEAMNTANLRTAYTQTAWVDEHYGERDALHDSYTQWKLQYLTPVWR